MATYKVWTPNGVVDTGEIICTETVIFHDELKDRLDRNFRADVYPYYKDTNKKICKNIGNTIPAGCTPIQPYRCTMFEGVGNDLFSTLDDGMIYPSKNLINGKIDSTGYSGREDLVSDDQYQLRSNQRIDIDGFGVVVNGENKKLRICTPVNETETRSGDSFFGYGDKRYPTKFNISGHPVVLLDWSQQNKVGKQIEHSISSDEKIGFLSDNTNLCEYGRIKSDIIYKATYHNEINKMDTISDTVKNFFISSKKVSNDMNDVNNITIIKLNNDFIFTLPFNEIYHTKKQESSLSDGNIYKNNIFKSTKKSFEKEFADNSFVWCNYDDSNFNTILNFPFLNFYPENRFYKYRGEKIGLIWNSNYAVSMNEMRDTRYYYANIIDNIRPKCKFSYHTEVLNNNNNIIINPVVNSICDLFKDFNNENDNLVLENGDCVDNYGNSIGYDHGYRWFRYVGRNCNIQIKNETNLINIEPSKNNVSFFGDAGNYPLINFNENQKVFVPLEYGTNTYTETEVNWQNKNWKYSGVNISYKPKETSQDIYVLWCKDYRDSEPKDASGTPQSDVSNQDLFSIDHMKNYDYSDLSN